MAIGTACIGVLIGGAREAFGKRYLNTLRMTLIPFVQPCLPKAKLCKPSGYDWMESVMMDSSVIRAHACSAGAPHKKGVNRRKNLAIAEAGLAVKYTL